MSPLSHKNTQFLHHNRSRDSLSLIRSFPLPHICSANNMTQRTNPAHTTGRLLAERRSRDEHLPLKRNTGFWSNTKVWGRIFFHVVLLGPILRYVVSLQPFLFLLSPFGLVLDPNSPSFRVQQTFPTSFAASSSPSPVCRCL